MVSSSCRPCIILIEKFYQWFYCLLKSTRGWKITAFINDIGKFFILIAEMIIIISRTSSCAAMQSECFFSLSHDTGHVCRIYNECESLSHILLSDSFVLNWFRMASYCCCRGLAIDVERSERSFPLCECSSSSSYDWWWLIYSTKLEKWP